MNFFILITGIIFNIFSVIVLLYVSMATMIGPWIAPIIVLICGGLFKLRSNFGFKIKKNSSKVKETVLIQSIGSVGGIIGVGMGFSLPTLYFLSPEIFNNLLKNPVYFCVFLAIICFCAGGLGIFLARSFIGKFINNKDLHFPVSQVVYEAIVSQNQKNKIKKMFFGFFGGWGIDFLRDGFLKIKSFLPKEFVLFPNIFANNIVISLTPMYWAIGFIAGAKIILPLLTGILLKYFILLPVNNNFNFFNLPKLSIENFNSVFCSGLILSEIFLSLIIFLKYVLKNIKNLNFYSNFFIKIINIKTAFKKSDIIFILFLGLLFFSFFSYLKFSFISQIFLIIFVIFATYQISYLGCKVGLVSFGKFATFIMIPMLLIFNLDFMQITMVCVFFNICSAVSSDLLFDYKIGQLCDIDFKKIYKYQWIGLIVTSASIGFFLWLFLTNFQPGTPALFAQRGKARAILIQSLGFDFRIILLGLFSGIILKKLKINPTMVLSGILMPNSLSIGLIIGGFFAKFAKKFKNFDSFWAGVFTGEALWLLLSILLKKIL
ncbi:MAG: OPT/YSL family transporter [Candidatus Babeliales bacterium]